MPGVAVGVYLDGEEHYAFHGVTSVENPLPVDENTLFQFGSTGKTFTATAIMRLVEQGRVRPRRPGARPTCPSCGSRTSGVADEVTVLQLAQPHRRLGRRPHRRARATATTPSPSYVELMADVEQVTPLGSSGVVQQRLAVGRRPDHREGHRPDLRAGDQGAALRAARPRPWLLLPERDHDPPLRRRSQPARRRHDHGGPAVGAAPQRQPGRRHLGQRRRPDRVGPLPPRRRDRRPTAPGCCPRSCSKQMQEPTVETCRAARSATTSASAGCCATSTACASSATAARRTASTRRSSWCPSATSPSPR